MHTDKGVVEHLKECAVILNDDGSVITSAEVVKLLDDDWHGVKIDYRFSRAPYAPYVFFAMTTSSGLRPGNVLQEGIEALDAYVRTTGLSNTSAWGAIRSPPYCIPSPAAPP